MLRATLFVLFLLHLFILPTVAIGPLHDLSLHTLYEYQFAQRMQWGTDLIETAGPFGFLHFADTYSGILWRAKILFQFAWAAVLSLLIVQAAWRFFANGGVRALWLAAAFLGLSSEAEMASTEGFPYLAILLAAAFLLGRGISPLSAAARVALAALLAFLSLMKVGNLPLCLLLVAVYAVQELVRKRPLAAVREAAAYSGFFALGWMAAGQSLAHLPAYFRHVLDFASGYNDSVALYEPRYMTMLGASALACVVIYSAWRFFADPPPREKAGWWVFAALCAFAVWKHGFVRADIHMYYFFDFALAAAALVFLPDVPAPRPAPNHPSLPLCVVGVAGFFLVVCLCSLGYGLFFERSLGSKFAYGSSALRERVRTLGRLRDHVAILDLQRADLRKRLALPRLRAAAGDGTADALTWEMNSLLLNGFRYRPRPIPLCYMAFNDALLRESARFLADDARAPEFLLADLFSFDERLAPMEDSLAKLEMLFRYRPVEPEKGKVLLKRVAGSTGPVLTAAGDERTFRFGQDIPVPQGKGLLWVKIRVQPTAVGRLRALLYKPPLIQLSWTEGGKGPPWRAARFLPALAETGFLVRPLICDNAQLLATYAAMEDRKADGPPPVQMLRLDLTDPATQRYVRDEIVVSFWSVANASRQTP